MNRNVTVVIDGQAGSCGKGKICGYIAQKDNIAISTNNWSSNAGHIHILKIMKKKLSLVIYLWL